MKICVRRAGCQISLSFTKHGKKYVWWENRLSAGNFWPGRVIAIHAKTEIKTAADPLPPGLPLSPRAPSTPPPPAVKQHLRDQESTPRCPGPYKRQPSPPPPTHPPCRPPRTRSPSGLLCRTWNGAPPGNGICYGKASNASGENSPSMVSGGVTPGPAFPPPPPVQIGLAAGGKPVSEIEATYASWNVDSSCNRGFHRIHFGNPNLLLAATGLQPSRLRFGG